MCAQGIVKNHYYEFLLLLPLLVEHIFDIFLVDHILNYKEHAMFLFFYTYLPWCQSFVMHGGYKFQIWHFFFTFTILRYMLPSLDWFYIFMMMILMFARHAGYLFIFTILPLFSWPEACWRLFNITYLSLSH